MNAVWQNTDCLNARALFHGIVVSVSSSPTLLPLQNDADAASSIGGSRYNTHPPGPLRVSNCDWLPLALMVQPVLACSVFFIAFPCIPLRTSHLVTPLSEISYKSLFLVTALTTILYMYVSCITFQSPFSDLRRRNRRARRRVAKTFSLFPSCPNVTLSSWPRLRAVLLAYGGRGKKLHLAHIPRQAGALRRRNDSNAVPLLIRTRERNAFPLPFALLTKITSYLV